MVQGLRDSGFLIQGWRGGLGLLGKGLGSCAQARAKEPQDPKNRSPVSAPDMDARDVTVLHHLPESMKHMLTCLGGSEKVNKVPARSTL